MTWRNNSSFVEDRPLQLYWDSTSLTTFISCPFKYYLSIVEGWVPKKRSPHLTFGLAIHEAFERYHTLRAHGTPHEEALHTIVAQVYFRMLLPHHEHYLDFSDPNKNPKTLLRAIIWYLDEYQNDHAKTLILPSGRPATELSFTIPIDDGFFYCGHFDRIVEFSGAKWVSDYKTSKSTLNEAFFAQFKPSVQFAGYTMAGQVVFEIPVRGVIVDALQLARTYCDFARRTVRFTPEELDEFLEDVSAELRFARSCAEANSWPRRPTSCHHYGGCAYRKICAHPPSVRLNFLRADFEQRIWDPRKAR